MSSRKLSALRACGADDGTANRTPSAWMISLVVFLAQRQIVFFVWVTFGERKWVTVQIPMVVDFRGGGGWARAGTGDGNEPQSVNSREAAAAEACRSASR